MKKSIPLFFVFFGIAIILMTYCFEKPNSNDHFEIDEDDVNLVLKEDNNRFEFHSYDLRVRLFLEKSTINDDFDEDSNSTIQNCLEYLKNHQNPNEPLIEKIISYVRSLDYISDHELYSRFDWAAYPIETIYYGGGDCEDLTILLVSLAYYAGYDCGIALFDNHAVALVCIESADADYRNPDGLHIEKDGHKYFIVESTDYYPIGKTYPEYTIDKIVSFDCVTPPK